MPKSSIHGQKFNDQNANGIRDEAEPGLDGWTIELLDAMTGRVLASGVTRSIDLDGNGVVDPVTERGLYMFDQLNPGTYQVREVLQPLWRQTFPVGRTMQLDLVETDAPSNGHSFKPAASSDGRFVAFESLADNLVTGDTNSASDIFVYDRLAGVVERINVSSTGREADAASFDPAISADGQVIAYRSLATGLVAGDRNNASDIFVYDRRTRTTTRITEHVVFGHEADDDSFAPAVSGDGRFVAFESFATNLVPGDSNAASDIFLHDLRSGLTERVSVSRAGLQANRDSLQPAISFDGRFVAYASFATNLVADDTNSAMDVFVFDRTPGARTVRRVSVAPVEGNGDSFDPSISDDGRFVAFTSLAGNLSGTDANGGDADIFVHDSTTGGVEHVSINDTRRGANSTSVTPSISGDGRFVVFASFANNIVPGDGNNQPDLFLVDRSAQSIERIGSNAAQEPDGRSDHPVLSGDGRVVVFSSFATNMAPDNSNQASDLFVHDNFGSHTVVAGIEGQFLGRDFGNVRIGNDAPDAVDDAIATDVHTPITVDVRNNDTDPNGDPLAVASVSPPAHGQTEINADGTVTYTPVAGTGSSDSFTYSLSDGRGGLDTATVSITVTDTTPPATPTGLATSPASPANHNNPTITGFAEPNSTVSLYKSAACNNFTSGSGFASSSGTFSIVVTVPDNTTSIFFATATDNFGNRSGCSPFGVTYVELSAFTLTVTTAGTGDGTITSVPAGINCGSSCTMSFTASTVVTLTATPDANSTFSGWSGACSGTGTCTVTMDAAKSATAAFALKTFALTVTKTGSGSGSVTSIPSGIACGSDCTETYTVDTSTTLTEVPDANSTFSGWSGPCTGTCTVSMDSVKNVTAVFLLNTFSLTVSKADKGNGVVTSSPAGIACGSDCTENYSTGSVVTLSAAADSESIFAGWGEDCTGTGPCTVTMSTSRGVKASFLRDADHDGVPDSIENAASNNGDANGDGILDSQQANVSSLSNAENGAYVTVVSPPGTSLAGVRAIDNPSPTDTPPNATFPFGFVDFAVKNLPANHAVAVTLLVPTNMQVNSYFKYGPTPDQPTPHWYSFKFEDKSQTGAKFSDINDDGTKDIILHFVDGLRGDDDLTANGVIVDPGALAYNSTPAFNFGNPMDVTGDGLVVPQDVLVVFNELNRNGARQLLEVPTDDVGQPQFVDVTGDGFVAPLDALAVINYLNALLTALAEGEATDGDSREDAGALRPTDPFESAPPPPLGSQGESAPKTQESRRTPRSRRTRDAEFAANHAFARYDAPPMSRGPLAPIHRNGAGTGTPGAPAALVDAAFATSLMDEDWFQDLCG